MPIDMKTVISNTFVSMVKQKGIDKITVKALIEACDISRQTFYYHFQDIMEVIGWSLEQAAKNLLAKSLEADTPEEALGILISSAVENRTLIRRLLDLKSVNKSKSYLFTLPGLIFKSLSGTSRIKLPWIMLTQKSPWISGLLG